MIDKLHKAIVAVVLCGLLGGAIAALLRFMIDIGALWSAVIILAGVVIWRWTSTEAS